MYTPHLPRVILGVCVVMLALGAGAQTTRDNASQSTAVSATSAPTGTPSIAGAGQPPNGTTHKPHKQHKHQKHHTVHNRSHSHGATKAVASAATDGETTYRAALRKCVEGPKARRDNCLNDAIARFGRP